MLATISQWIQQPGALHWLLLVSALALAVIAVCAVLGAVVLIVLFKYIRMRSSFAEQAQPLLDAGDLDSLVALCRQRLATYHDDASAHYFMGLALHWKGDLRLALT